VVLFRGLTAKFTGFLIILSSKFIKGAELQLLSKNQPDQKDLANS
jgi:hypothetical protein